MFRHNIITLAIRILKVRDHTPAKVYCDKKGDRIEADFESILKDSVFSDSINGYMEKR